MPSAEPRTRSCAPESDVEAVRFAAHSYEDALVAGDVAAATAWFESEDDVSRFGPDGVQLGPAAVAAARASQAPQLAPIWILDEARSLGPDIVIHLAVLRRGDAWIQRSQVWRRGAAGWRIAHAHVAKTLEPATVQR